MKDEVLHTESRPGYLYARANGHEMTVEVARAVIQEAIEAARTFGHRRILYESVRIQRRLTIGDFFALSHLLGEALPGLRAALVVPKELYTPEVNFFEAASRHHGATLQYFTDFFDAEHWLLSA